MKLRLLTLPLGALALAAVSSAQFADQTLAVVLLNGNPASGALGSAVNLSNYSKGGSTIGTPVSLGMFSNGSSTLEGTLQSDGGNPFNLYVSGYSSAVTTGSISSTTGASNPRVVKQFNALTGAITTTTLGASDLSGGGASGQNGNPRTGVYVGGRLYAAGTANGTGNEFGILRGTQGAAFGGTQDLVQAGTVPTAVRTLHVVEGSLYFNGQRNVFTTDASSTTPTYTQLFAADLTLSISDFRFADANTLYLADETAANGGLFVSTYSGTAWSAPTRVGTSTVGLQKIAFDGTSIFGTTYQTTANSLVSINLSTGVQTTLATAATGQGFRGVEVVPEPATMAAMALGLGALAARRRRKSA